MMRAVDDFLIDRIFQPAVNWCGRMFGWTQWGIAKQANYAALACGIVFNALRLLNDVSAVRVAISLGLAMLWFLIFNSILVRFGAVKDGSSRFRAAYPFFRLFMASFSIIFIPAKLAVSELGSVHLGDLKLVVEFIGLYAMACADPPPKEVRHTRLAMAGAG